MMQNIICFNKSDLHFSEKKTDEQMMWFWIELIKQAKSHIFIRFFLFLLLFLDGFSSSGTTSGGTSSRGSSSKGFRVGKNFFNLQDGKVNGDDDVRQGFQSINQEVKQCRYISKCLWQRLQVTILSLSLPSILVYTHRYPLIKKLECIGF